MLKWFIFISLMVPHLVCGQTYLLEKSRITFFSEAPLENIDATSLKARSIFRADDAQIAFQIPVNSFKFKKS